MAPADPRAAAVQPVPEPRRPEVRPQAGTAQHAPGTATPNAGHVPGAGPAPSAAGAETRWPGGPGPAPPSPALGGQQPAVVNGQQAVHNRAPAPVDIRDTREKETGDAGRQRRKRFPWIKVAAVLVIAILIGAGAAFWVKGNLDLSALSGLLASEPKSNATPVVKAPAGQARQPAAPATSPSQLASKGASPQAAPRAGETAVPFAPRPASPPSAAAPPPAQPATPGGGGVAVPAALADADASLQQQTVWQVLKRNFPDWYLARLQDVSRMRAESGGEQAVLSALTQAMVKLRRDNASAALAASPDHLRHIASLFVDNLIRLSQTSTQACYGFISSGETDPAILDLMRTSDLGKSLNAQLAAVFEAIADGKRAPQQHGQAQRADFDALATQLGQRGWKPQDLQLFSDARALSKAPQDIVCKMVQDWFQAQLSVKDEGIQIRLLVETLKPVIAG